MKILRIKLLGNVISLNSKKRFSDLKKVFHNICYRNKTKMALSLGLSLFISSQEAELHSFKSLCQSQIYTFNYLKIAQSNRILDI